MLFPCGPVVQAYDNRTLHGLIRFKKERYQLSAATARGMASATSCTMYGVYLYGGGAVGAPSEKAS